MENERQEARDRTARGLQSTAVEADNEMSDFRLTQELFEELHAAEDSPERIVQLLSLSPEAIRSALSSRNFNEGEKKSLRELLAAAEALAQREHEPSLGFRLDELISATLHRLGVPTRDEIHSLTQKVEELTARVEGLKLESAPAQGMKATQEAAPAVGVITRDSVVRADG